MVAHLNYTDTALFSVRQGRWIDYNFKSEITGTGNLGAISSIV